MGKVLNYKSGRPRGIQMRRNLAQQSLTEQEKLAEEGLKSYSNGCQETRVGDEWMRAAMLGIGDAIRGY